MSVSTEHNLIVTSMQCVTIPRDHTYARAKRDFMEMDETALVTIKYTFFFYQAFQAATFPATQLTHLSQPERSPPVEPFNSQGPSSISVPNGLCLLAQDEFSGCRTSGFCGSLLNEVHDVPPFVDSNREHYGQCRMVSFSQRNWPVQSHVRLLIFSHGSCSLLMW